jgi:hypothetical protein
MQLFNTGATNSQKLGGFMAFSVGNSATTVAGNGAFNTASVGSDQTSFYGTSAEDSTAAKTLSVTVTLSASTARFTQEMSILEFIQ